MGCLGIAHTIFIITRDFQFLESDPWNYNSVSHHHWHDSFTTFVEPESWKSIGAARKIR
jgi:hypothetical protein